MRISDWSSDVCSSDLGGGSFFHIRKRFRIEHQAVANAPLDIVVGRHPPSLTRAGRQIKVHRILAHGHDNRETDEQTLDRRGLGRNARFCEAGKDVAFSSGTVVSGFAWRGVAAFAAGIDAPDGAYDGDKRHISRSEGHTSELQSL